MLTAEQLQVFADDIAANTDPVVVDALAHGNNNGIREWYAETAVPDFWVFVSTITVSDIKGAMAWSADYANFKDDMEAIRFLLANGEYDPRPKGSREALNSVFAACPTTKSGILDIAVRKVNRTEKLFAVADDGLAGGDGSAKNAAAIAVVEGPASLDDVRAAVALIGG